MSETHSKAKIKRTDGVVVTVTFKELLETDEAPLKEQVHNLSDWIGELSRLKDTILQQKKDLKDLWDEYHTKDICRAMDDCIEQIDEAIQNYQMAYDNLVLLVSVYEHVASWVAAHPDYIKYFIGYDNTKYYYCRQVTKKSSGKHANYKTIGEPITLSFPS